MNGLVRSWLELRNEKEAGCRRCAICECTDVICSSPAPLRTLRGLGPSFSQSLNRHGQLLSADSMRHPNCAINLLAAICLT
jgi:hypothetical protein